MHDYTNGNQGDEQDTRPGRWQGNRAQDQIGADHRRKCDQRPIEQDEEEDRADDSADQKRDPIILFGVNEKRYGQSDGEFTAGQKTGDGDRDLLQEEREQRADEAERDRYGKQHQG